MKKILALATPVLTLAFISASSLAAQQYGPPPQQPPRPPQQQGYPQQGYPQQGYQQGGGQWDAPPAEFNDLNRRAFHDGMEAARNDWRAHQPMVPQRSAMYRRPPTPRMLRDEYRRSFSRGYQVAMDHRDRWQDHDGRRDHDGYRPN